MYTHKIIPGEKQEVLLITATGTVSRIFQADMEDQMRIALKAYPTWKLLKVTTTHSDITNRYAPKEV